MVPSTATASGAKIEQAESTVLACCSMLDLDNGSHRFFKNGVQHGRAA
jgi:hypothetical protein